MSEFNPAFDMPETRDQAIAVMATWGDPLTQTFSAKRAARCAELVAGPPHFWLFDFQHRVSTWLQACFSPSVCKDVQERGDRFLEESLELLQANGYDRDRVAKLVDYVYGRPVGDTEQEIGGVMVTLAAYCHSIRCYMHTAAERELARISAPEVIEKIRIKQASKRDIHSPLP